MQRQQEFLATALYLGLGVLNPEGGLRAVVEGYGPTTFVLQHPENPGLHVGRIPESGELGDEGLKIPHPALRATFSRREKENPQVFPSPLGGHQHS
jgi:hypothetical protein